MKDFFRSILRWSVWFFAALTALVALDTIIHAAAPVLLSNPFCLAIYLFGMTLAMLSTLAGFAGNCIFLFSGFFYLCTIKKTPMSEFKANPNVWKKSCDIIQSYSYTASGYVYSYIPRNFKNFIVTALLTFIALTSSVLPFTLLAITGGLFAGFYIFDFVVNYSLSEIFYCEQEKLEERHEHDCI